MPSLPVPPSLRKSLVSSTAESARETCPSDAFPILLSCRQDVITSAIHHLAAREVVDAGHALGLLLSQDDADYLAHAVERVLLSYFVFERRKAA